MNTLPTAEHFSRLFVLTGLLAIAAGCTDKEEPTSTLATTQFTLSESTFTENEGEQIISLSLDRPAPSNAQIVVKANAIVPSCYSTFPQAQLGQLTLPVSEGQTSVSFKIIPTDNSSLDGSKQIKFTISGVTAGLRIGSTHELLVSVNDDEVPVSAGFELSSMNVRENTDAPGKITVTFSAPAPADGILVFKLQSSSGYGVGYSTQPAAVGDKIFLQVSKDATYAKIEIYPINDQAFKPDRNINLKMIEATGGIKIGENSELWCSITEDDGHQITTIESVRQQYTGESTIIHMNSYIEGIVTSIDNIPGGRVVLEDATGALQLQFATSHSLTRGDLVLVNMNFGLLHDSNGTLEVTQISEFEKLGQDIVRTNKVTLADLLHAGKLLESQTVQLSGVYFTDADGTQTFRGDRILTDGDRTIIVRTGDLADFRDDVVPDGLLNVTGIFMKLAEDLYLLYPQERKDIKKQQFMLIRD